MAHVMRNVKVDEDIWLENFIAQKVKDLLEGRHAYLYSAKNKIYATVTADTILQEECLYIEGDAAELLKDPEAFGRRLQTRMKEEIEKWCSDNADLMMEGPDNE